MDANHYGEIIGLISGSIGLIAITYALSRKFFKKTKGAFEKITRISEFLGSDEEILQFKSALQKIEEELTLNGGKSLKDTVHRLETTIQDIKDMSHLNSLRWRLADRMATMGIYECDAAGSCIYVNPTLCKIFGMQESEMLGNGWLVAVGNNSQERADVWKAWTDSIKYNIPYEISYTIRNQTTRKKYKVHTYAIAHKSIFENKIMRYYGVLDLLETNLEVIKEVIGQGETRQGETRQGETQG